jgi:hypothetical protein
MTLDAIKEAIRHLPEDDRHKLSDWFGEMEDAVWDSEIARDFSPGGRGEEFLKELQLEASGGMHNRSRKAWQSGTSHSLIYRSVALPGFWQHYDKLPVESRLLPMSSTRFCAESFSLFIAVQAGWAVLSVRIAHGYRALALRGPRETTKANPQAG